MKKYLCAGNRSQVVVLLILAIVWALFTQSGVFDKNLWWADYLFVGRLTLAVLALVAAAWVFFVPQPNILSRYLLVAAVFQALCAALEDTRQFEFYEYVSYFLLLNVLAFEGSIREWMQQVLLIATFVCVFPLLFKDSESFSSLPAFLYNLTTPVVVVFLSAIVLRLNTSRFDALRQNVSLQAALLEAERSAKERALAELDSARSQIERNAIQVAVASLMQMLAHDIRRPFSLLRMGLSMLRSATTPEKMQKIVVRLESELEKSLLSVDGMISDIMISGASEVAELERINMADLLAKNISVARLIRPKTDVTVDMMVGNDLYVRVDAKKIDRVIANILDNAFEAVEKSGRIWIATQQVSVDGFLHVQVTVGNSGSFVDKSNYDKVFEPFFTQGKRDGTGLGLAIARKIVTAHGGSIYCRSSPDMGTEFVFTLSAAS